MLLTTTSSLSLAENSYLVGNLGVVVPDMNGVLVSVPPVKFEDVVEVASIEAENIQDVVTKAYLCDENNEGCMELETK